jgi:hypothetical protein
MEQRLLTYLLVVGFSFSLFGKEKPAKSRPITWSHDVGFFLGGSYYVGDLNPLKHFYMTQPAVGLFYRFNQNKRVAYRGGFNYGVIMGDDSQSDEPDQIQRNLNFKSKLLEFNGIAEFNFWNYRINHNKASFSPMAEVQGKYIELQPLATEGQGTPLNPETKKRYRLTQFTIPFGLGAKLNLSRNVGLSLEWGLRKTFTDYLDDVSKQYVNPSLLAQEKGPLSAYLSNRSLNNDGSFDMTGTQRGNPFIKDWYSFFGFQISIQVHGRPKPCGAYPRKSH